jgi:hypothetical protein
MRSWFGAQRSRREIQVAVKEGMSIAKLVDASKARSNGNAACSLPTFRTFQEGAAGEGQ